MQSQKISAVICTFNRSRDLRLALAAFERQTLSSKLFELLVVDNGSTDDTPEVCEGFRRRNGFLRYVREDRAGLSIARNRGLREAATEIVAYTDDDAVVDPGWLSQLLAAFETLPDDTGIVGGDVTPVWAASRPDWLNDHLLRPLSAGLKWSEDPRFLRRGEWLVEVNSAYRKAALQRVEGFPEQLGRVGDLLLSGDGAANVLIERAGYRLYYDPRILVRHNIPAERTTKTWLRRRSFWQGISMNLLHRYVEDMSTRLSLNSGDRSSARAWEEIRVPVSASAWSELFDDSAMHFSEQLFKLEQLGYLLESQSVVVGR